MRPRTYLAAAAVLVLALAAHASGGDEPPAAGRQKRIQKLVAELGGDDFDRREAAQRELEEAGEEAVPDLETAQAAAADPEVRRRLAEVLDPLCKAIGDRQCRKLLAGAAGGNVDVLVERLTRKGRAGADEQETLQKTIAAIAEKAGGKDRFSLQFEDKSWPVTRRVLINEAAAEELGHSHIATGRLIMRGPVITHADLCTAVVFVNDDFTLGPSAVNSLIVCDGDVKVRDAEHCVIIAGGSITLERCADCVLAARGAVRVKGDPANTEIQENGKGPLGAATFLDPSELGAEMSVAGGEVRIAKVGDGAPMAKAGLRVGDVVASVDGAEVSSLNAFRRALRRGLVEGKAVLKVRRGGDDLVTSIRRPD